MLTTTDLLMNLVFFGSPGFLAKREAETICHFRHSFVRNFDSLCCNTGLGLIYRLLLTRTKSCASTSVSTYGRSPTTAAMLVSLADFRLYLVRSGHCQWFRKLGLWRKTSATAATRSPLKQGQMKANRSLQDF